MAQKIGRTSFLCCFPTTKAEFVEQWKNRKEGDYLLAQYSKVETDEAQRVWPLYASLARKLSDLVAALREMGVEVHERATLDDFLASCRASQTVILLAHWRHSAFFPHHIPAPEGTRQTLRSIARSTFPRPHPVFATFRGDLQRQDWLWESDDLGDLIDGLDTLVKWIAQSPLLEDRYDGSESLRESQARGILDELLVPCILPGNRLELGDGLFDPRSLTSAGPFREDVVVDLLVCRSYVLACTLKSIFGERVVFVSGYEPVSIYPRALIALKSLRLAVDCECSYEEASRVLRAEISRQCG